MTLSPKDRAAILMVMAVVCLAFAIQEIGGNWAMFAFYVVSAAWRGGHSVYTWTRDK